jgi:excisionase family DNA binding protein
MSTTALPEIEPLLTTREVCTIFGITPKTVYRWTRTGMLPRVELNSRLWRYRRSDVQALIDGMPAAESDQS